MTCLLIGFDVSYDLTECHFIEEFRTTGSGLGFTSIACFDIVDGGFRDGGDVGDFA